MPDFDCERCEDSGFVCAECSVFPCECAPEDNDPDGLLIACPDCFGDEDDDEDELLDDDEEDDDFEDEDDFEDDEDEI